MAGGEVDDATAAEETPDAPGHFPGFVEFLAREAAGMTDGARNPVEQGVAGKPIEIAVCEASF